MSKPGWKGEEELSESLKGLCGHSNAIPVSKIKQLVTICNKHSADYKMVVHDIERFIRKTKPEDRLAGLALLDSLCKQHSKEKEVFAKRFSQRLKETVSYLHQASAKHKETVLRFINEWVKRQAFPPDILQGISAEWSMSSAAVAASSSASGSAAIAAITTAAATTATSTPSYQPPFQSAAVSQYNHQPNHNNNTSSIQQQQQQLNLDANYYTTITGEDITSGSLLDQQQQQQLAMSAAAVVADTATNNNNNTTSSRNSNSNNKCTYQDLVDIKKAAKLCPFRDGNCPYNEKCRYAHYDTNTLEQYAARLLVNKHYNPPTTAQQQPTSANSMDEIMAASSVSIELASLLDQIMSSTTTVAWPTTLTAADYLDSLKANTASNTNTSNINGSKRCVIDEKLAASPSIQAYQQAWQGNQAQSLQEQTQAEKKLNQQVYQFARKKVKKAVPEDYIPCHTLPTQPKFFCLSQEQFQDLLVKDPFSRSK